jgi:hypothetical protein
MVDLITRALTLAVLLAVCPAAVAPAHAGPAGAAESSSEYTLVPVSIMLLPAVSLPPATRPKTLAVVALNCGVGYTDRLSGVGAGIITLVGEDGTGVMAGVGNYAGGSFTGVQHGVVNLSVDGVRGVQSGVTNLTFRRLEGVQAGVANFAADFKGAQFGVVNVAGRGHGLQAGLINVARELEGVPLGLVNIVLHGGLTQGLVWYDELGAINAALLHGSRLVYNIYTLGVDQDRQWWTGSFGLGIRLRAGRGSLSMEAVTGGVLWAERREDSDPVLVQRARIYARAPITRRAALIAGASFNYAFDLDGGIPELPAILHGVEFPFSSDRHRFWPGLFAGLEL